MHSLYIAWKDYNIPIDANKLGITFFSCFFIEAVASAKQLALTLDFSGDLLL